MLATTVTPTTVAPTSAADSSPDALQQLLNTRANAVMSHDANAYMATVDPTADGEFRDAQRRTFNGLSALPLKSYALELHPSDELDAANALDLAAFHHSDGALLPETRQLIQFDGYDDRPSIDSLWMTYVSRGDKWFVAAGEDGELIGLHGAQNIWDLGSIEFQRSDHFLTIYTPGQLARANALTAIAESALTTFSTRWTKPWSQRIPIIVPASPDQAAKLLDTQADISEFVAFVSYRTLRDAKWTVSAPRMFAQDASLADKSNASQRGTVVHELTHAAGSNDTGPNTASWLHEGLAEFLRQDKRTDIAPGSPGKLELPSPADFESSGPDLQNAYADASSAMSFLASLKGADAPASLFEAVGARRQTPGTPSYNVDEAFKLVAGLEVADFVAQWNVKFGRPLS